MKSRITIFLIIILISCAANPDEQKQPANLYEQIAQSDSVEVWTTQWESMYTLNTCDFKEAQSIYGGVLFIYGDTLYEISPGSGCYDKFKLDKTDTKISFRENNTYKTLDFIGDSLYVLYDSYKKVNVTDTCKYRIVFSHYKRMVPTYELITLLRTGKKDTLSKMKEEFLGIKLSEWVISITLAEYPRCK